MPILNSGKQISGKKKKNHTVNAIHAFPGIASEDSWNSLCFSPNLFLTSSRLKIIESMSVIFAFSSTHLKWNTDIGQHPWNSSQEIRQGLIALWWLVNQGQGWGPRNSLFSKLNVHVNDREAIEVSHFFFND